MDGKWSRSTIWSAALACLLVVCGAGCASSPTYYHGDLAEQGEGPYTIAVLPPLNLSRYDQASDIIANNLVVELLNSRQFQVVDPGLVETAIVNRRVRLTDRLSLDVLRQLGEDLNVTYLMLGTVNEFGFVHDGGENLPSISITLRIVTCANGRIVWAASHSRRGDDAETVFRMGRIETLEQLASVTVRELAETLSR